MEKRQQKIIVPIDGSPASLEAIKVGGAFASNHNSELVLLYVVEPASSLFAEADDLAEKHRAWGIRLLENAKKNYSGPEVEISSMIVVGKPYKAINEAAEEILAEMIVVGAFGKSSAGSGMLGSNVQKLIRTARIPVVTVSQSPKSGYFSKILLPVDPSFGAIELERFLYDYHKVYNPVIELFTVCKNQEELEEARTYLDKQVNMLSKAGLKDVSGTPIIGDDPSFEILKYVVDNGHDIIWMETHGRKGIANWFFGSVTQEVLQQAVVPVLTLHPEREPLKTYYYHSNLPI